MFLAGKVDNVSAYIDDIAIFSNTTEKHFLQREYLKSYKN